MQHILDTVCFACKDDDVVGLELDFGVGIGYELVVAFDADDDALCAFANVAVGDGGSDEGMGIGDGKASDGDGNACGRGIFGSKGIVEHLSETVDLFITAGYDNLVAGEESGASARNIDVDACTHDAHDADTGMLTDVELHERLSAET